MKHKKGNSAEQANSGANLSSRENPERIIEQTATCKTVKRCNSHQEWYEDFIIIITSVIIIINAFPSIPGRLYELSIVWPCLRFKSFEQEA